MPQRYTKQKPKRCVCCPKDIPTNGFGYASHMNMHVRKGEATKDYNTQYGCHEYRPVKEKQNG
jgi:hypothetical protein